MAWQPDGPGELGPAVAARGLAAITVPDGFEVAVAVSSDLVSFPMLGTLDDRGRLFFAESSGNTVRTPEMAENPDYIVRLVEDLDGDGVYDSSTIFADKLTEPNGAVWYEGSLYVSTPPDLPRLEDTDGDGVADVKEVLLSGWVLSANAASMHGPFLGPDGRLYITDGRHAVAEQALTRLVEAGEVSVDVPRQVRGTAAEARARAVAVFGLLRIGGKRSLADVREALDDGHFLVRMAAARGALDSLAQALGMLMGRIWTGTIGLRSARAKHRFPLPATPLCLHARRAA